MILNTFHHQKQQQTQAYNETAKHFFIHRHELWTKSPTLNLHFSFICRRQKHIGMYLQTIWAGVGDEWKMPLCSIETMNKLLVFEGSVMHFSPCSVFPSVTAETLLEKILQAYPSDLQSKETSALFKRPIPFFDSLFRSNLRLSPNTRRERAQPR